MDLKKHWPNFIGNVGTFQGWVILAPYDRDKEIPLEQKDLMALFISGDIENAVQAPALRTFCLEENKSLFTEDELAQLRKALDTYESAVENFSELPHWQYPSLRAQEQHEINSRNEYLKSPERAALVRVLKRP